MRLARESMKKSMSGSLWVYCIIPLLLYLYFRFSPDQHLWFPKCPFFLMTGLQCPACGSQRALHSFLNGQLSEAIAYNPFLVISLPYLAGLAYTTFSRSKAAGKARKYVQNRWVTEAYLILLILWWITRNMG